jgi:hypothetical protein
MKLNMMNGICCQIKLPFQGAEKTFPIISTQGVAIGLG